MHNAKAPRFYLLLLFSFLLCTASAQFPSFNHHVIGSEEGLNNANIFNIRQHRNGVMYFTTQNGVYCYDGFNCVQLAIDSLRTNALLTVAFKGDDELYLSIRNEGISVYNLRTKKYDRPAALRIPDNNADELYIDGSYAYLLNSGIRLVVKDLRSGKMLGDEVNRRDRLNLAYCMYRTRNGKVLAGRSDGIYEVSGGTQTRVRWAPSEPIHSLSEDRDGNLIAGTGSAILRFNSAGSYEYIHPVYRKKKGTLDFAGNNSVNNLIADRYGRIWFTCTPDESLYLQDNNATHDIFGILGIPSSLIRCIYKDREENIWVGTYSEGVYFIQNTFFRNFSFFNANKNLNINQADLRNDLLIAATSNGLYALNLASNQSRILSAPDETFTEPIFSIVNSGNVIYYTKFSQFHVSPTVLVDGKEGYRFRPVIAKVLYLVSEQESIIADRELNILLTSPDGATVKDTLVSFSDYRLSVNAMLRNGNYLYIGTNSGLYRYDFNTRTNTFLNADELSYNINDLAFINGEIWAAHEAGVTSVNRKRLVRRAGEFTLNSVRRIRQLNGRIWLATLDGVFICDTGFTPAKILSRATGLLSNSINDIAFRRGKALISTGRGVSVADISAIEEKSPPLRPVIISDVRSNGASLVPQEGRLNLRSEDDNIAVAFYSPQYQRPNNQYIRFRTDNAEWSTARNVTTVNIALPGGRHTIEISASPDNIHWTEPAVLQVVKDQKLSERQSVYALGAIGSVVLIILISTLWVRRVKINARKRLGVEQQVNLLKHQAMNALLSPHFIFNSLTSIQNYINTNNSLRASEYLAKFSRLIRMIIEKAALSEISLHDELSRLTYYLELEKERFKNKFDYHIHLDENINTHTVMIPNMIIQPYVENCILHGILPKQQHGELQISFRMQPSRILIITIEDNGIGLIKAAEHAKTGHKSLGTSTIRSILEVNSKLSGRKQTVTMQDKSTVDPQQTGTIITIRIEL